MFLFQEALSAPHQLIHLGFEKPEEDGFRVIVGRGSRGGGRGSGRAGGACLSGGGRFGFGCSARRLVGSGCGLGRRSSILGRGRQGFRIYLTTGTSRLGATVTATAHVR